MKSIKELLNDFMKWLENHPKYNPFMSNEENIDLFLEDWKKLQNSIKE
jgi:hypothetical protein